MSTTPLQTKMFLLARADPVLQGYLLGANNTFRFFPVQLPKGYIYQGACVVVRQISDVLPYYQGGPLSLDAVQMQIDCYDLDSLVAQALASYLVLNWFPRADFQTNSQFTSPPGPPLAAANFKLSQRSGLDYQVQPQPAWVETLTYRILNNTNT